MFQLPVWTLMSESAMSAPVCDSRSSFCRLNMNSKARLRPANKLWETWPTLSIEAYFNCCKICVHETLKDSENGVLTRHDCVPVSPAIVSCLRKPPIIAQQRHARTRGHQTAGPTAPCSTPARDTLSWSMSAWGVSSCNFSKPSCKFQKLTCPPDNHARTFDMSGYILACLGHTDWHYFEAWLCTMK